MKVTLVLPEGTQVITVTAIYDDPNIKGSVRADVGAANVEDGGEYDLRQNIPGESE